MYMYAHNIAFRLRDVRQGWYMCESPHKFYDKFPAVKLGIGGLLIFLKQVLQ